jgi:hypothetical protein
MPKLPLPSPYDWTARLQPALLTILPAFVLIAVWMPEVWTLLGALSGLLATCGVTYLLGQVARAWGKRLETRFPEWGPALTVALLRHADPRIDRRTKARYHQFLAGQGHDLPCAQTEQEDPADADSCYRACATWLLEATRDEKRFGLLLRENIAYGFRRNLLAMKPLALPILAACLVANGSGLWMTRVEVGPQFWLAAFVELGLSAALVAWSMAVNRAFWAEASLTMGLRLLACCDTLSIKTTKADGKRRAKTASA